MKEIDINNIIYKWVVIWSEVSKSIKREIDSDVIYNEKFLKTRVKYYKGKITKHFYGKDAREVGFNHICIPIILIDSILEEDGKFYRQVFLNGYIDEEIELNK